MKQKKKDYLRFILISTICLLISPSLSAQMADKEVVIDKVVAKVDNYIILKSELELSYLDYLSQGKPSSPTLKCQILQSLIQNKTLMAQADIDSLVVDDSEVNENLDRRIQVMNQQFGSEEQIEKAYGKSMETIRLEVFDNIKEQLTIQKMQSELSSTIKISPSEVKTFFASIPQDSLPYFSTEVTVGQIVKKVKAGKQQKEKVNNLLFEIKENILSGKATFEEMAKKYSEDPGSNTRGGDLPFFGRGELAPEYEATALSHEVGTLSDPIESQFGYHLIELQERRGNRFKTRHILITPKPDESDFERTAKVLDSLRLLIINDSLDFQEVATEHSDDQQTSSAGGFFQDESGSLNVSSEYLDPNIFFTIDTMQVGELTRPMKYQESDGKYAFRVIYFSGKKPPHIANLNDDYQKISQATLAQKKNQRIIKWYEKARKNVFIKVDEEFDYCNIENN